ncbi:MAG: nucleotidyltransferase domain-containing protein [Acidobacteria bacterium]|nr:nucleotidyltransferase domain-containing protein [Candidatus Sulfomarinibacter kjeldsenii]
MNRRQIEQSVTEELASADDRLVAAYLFGSVARGTDSSNSDIDVGILLRTAPSSGLNDLRFELEGHLERALGRRTQVVILNNAPPDLLHRVLRDGRLLVERDRAARIRFEVRARNEYFDLLPILKRYRRREAAGA